MGLRDFALQGGVPSRAGPTEARSRKLARPREAAPPGLGRYPVHQFNPRFGGDSHFNTTTPFSRAVVAWASPSFPDTDRQVRDREVERNLQEAGVPLLRLENQGHFDPSDFAQKIQHAVK
jgi:hypothetical protein